MTELSKQDTYTKVVAIIAEKLSVESKSITGDATLHDLGADSIDLVKIIMGLEEQLGIAIDDQKAEKLNNVNDLVDYVYELRSQK